MSHQLAHPPAMQRSLCGFARHVYHLAQEQRTEELEQRFREAFKYQGPVTHLGPGRLEVEGLRFDEQVVYMEKDGELYRYWRVAIPYHSPALGPSYRIVSHIINLEELGEALCQVAQLEQEQWARRDALPPRTPCCVTWPTEGALQ